MAMFRVDQGQKQKKLSCSNVASDPVGEATPYRGQWCSLVGSGRRQPELHMDGVPDVITSPSLPWAENYVLVMTITLYVIHSSACRWWVRGMVVGTSLSLSRCLVHCVFRLHYSHGRRVDREFLTGTCL